MRNKMITMILGAILLSAILINTVGCSVDMVQAADLMDGIKSVQIEGKSADEDFVASAADFGMKIFQKNIKQNENSLVSPLSVMLALAMTANGANGETKAEMESLLGGEIKLDDLNRYLYSFSKELTSSDKAKFKLANSIWFRDDEGRLTVEKEFLQKNADYYSAAAYKAAFDKQTTDDINSWVKTNTDGMIEKILDDIDPDAVMYLINALVFDARWENVYNKNAVFDSVFTSIDGIKQDAQMMNSTESRYIDDGKAKGFVKDYEGKKFSFVGLLPNENISIYDYVESLSGEEFLKTFKEAYSKQSSVVVNLPKFSYDYDIIMNESLKQLGMPTAFDSGKADFSKIGRSSFGNMFIGDVIHKTFISVDELGTKAGAVTVVEVKDEGAIMANVVTFNRPFVYAIVDNATGLPIFMGVVTDITN